MVRCSIEGCKSDSEKKIDGLSFHSFPDDLKLRNLWIAATKRIDWNPKRSSKICSEHFDRELLWKVGMKTFLKPNSIPTTLTGSENQKVNGSIAMEVDNKELTCLEDLGTGSIEALEVLRSTASTSMANATIRSICPRCYQNVTEKVTSSSPDSTPRTLKRKWKSQQKISEQRLKKLKALREKYRRLTKKVADLENIISELKTK